MKNKKIIIFGLIFIVLVIVFFINFAVFDKKHNTTQTPETAGDIKTVTITDTSGELYNTFVNDEYLQIRKHLANFIESKNGNPNEIVEASNITYPTRDNEGNDYSFDVYSPSLDNTYHIVINKPRDNRYPAYFEVKNENYKVNLFDYTSTNGANDE